MEPAIHLLTQSVQAILVSQKDMTLDKVPKLADAIVEATGPSVNVSEVETNASPETEMAVLPSIQSERLTRTRAAANGSVICGYDTAELFLELGPLCYFL